LSKGEGQLAELEWRLAMFRLTALQDGGQPLWERAAGRRQEHWDASFGLVFHLAGKVRANLGAVYTYDPRLRAHCP